MSAVCEESVDGAHEAGKRVLDLSQGDEHSVGLGPPSEVGASSPSLGQADKFVTEWSLYCSDDESEGASVRAGASQ